MYSRFFYITNTRKSRTVPLKFFEQSLKNLLNYSLIHFPLKVKREKWISKLILRFKRRLSKLSFILRATHFWKSGRINEKSYFSKRLALRPAIYFTLYFMKRYFLWYLSSGQTAKIIFFYFIIVYTYEYAIFRIYFHNTATSINF